MGARGWRPSIGRAALAAVASMTAVAACVPRPAASDPAPPPRVALAAGAPALAVQEFGGARPGPTVALVAGVHGGKRAAVAALETLATRLRAAELRGRVLLVPRANAPAIGSGLAQLSPLDSLNLNRVFPGRGDGRPTERLAHRIMHEIVARSDYLVDLHGADGEEAVDAFAYAARPGLDARVDSAALRLARLWGTPRVVWDTEGPRTVATSRFLQTAAHLSGVPAITVFEAGRKSDDADAAARFGDGALRLLAGLGVIAPGRSEAASDPVVHQRRAVSLAASAGDWRPLVRPGQAVRAGELLGTLAGSSGERLEVRTEVSGVVLHQRLPAQVPAQAALIILAVGP